MLSYPEISMYCQFCQEYVTAKCDGGKVSCERCKLTISNKKGKKQ